MGQGLPVCCSGRTSPNSQEDGITLYYFSDASVVLPKGAVCISVDAIQDSVRDPPEPVISMMKDKGASEYDDMVQSFRDGMALQSSYAQGDPLRWNKLSSDLADGLVLRFAPRFVKYGIDLYLVRDGPVGSHSWLVFVDRAVNDRFVPRHAREAVWASKDEQLQGGLQPPRTWPTRVAEVPKSWPVLKAAPPCANNLPGLERLDTTEVPRVNFTGNWRLTAVEGDMELFTKELAMNATETAYVQNGYRTNGADPYALAVLPGETVDVISKHGTWITVRTASGMSGDVPESCLKMQEQPTRSTSTGALVSTQQAAAAGGAEAAAGEAEASQVQQITQRGNDLIIESSGKTQTLRVGIGDQRMINLEDGRPIIVRANWVDDGVTLLIRGTTDAGKAIPTTKWFLQTPWRSSTQMVIQSVSPFGTTVRRYFDKVSDGQ